MIKGGDLVECLQSCRPSHTLNRSLRREATVIGGRIPVFSFYGVSFVSRKLLGRKLLSYQPWKLQVL